MHARLRSAAAVTALLIAAMLGGCATPPPASDPDAVADFNQTNDPLEPTNRVFFAVNNGLDTVLIRPLAIGYRDAVPAPVRDHVHDALVNLGEPVTLIDDMLQAKPRRAGDSWMRFIINSTIGIGGFFDVADGWGWKEHDSDAGITLALWGMPDGVYLFLPILGPSNPRDAIGFGTDIAMDWTTWVGHGAVVTGLDWGSFGLKAVDARERVLDDLDKVMAEALDPYATIRSLSRQHRDAVIQDAREDHRATVPAWFPQPASPPPTH